MTDQPGIWVLERRVLHDEGSDWVICCTFAWFTEEQAVGALQEHQKEYPNQEARLRWYARVPLPEERA